MTQKDQDASHALYTDQTDSDQLHTKRPKLEKTLLRILKSFSISKNIIILVLSGIFVSLVIANMVVFLLPRSNVSPILIAADTPTPNPTKSAATPSVTPSKAQPSTTATITPSKPPTATPTRTPTPQPTATPTPTRIPTPTRLPTFTDNTYGQLESANCQSITGWAYDPAAPNDPINVWLYADGGVYGGIMSGNVDTNILRADINQSKNISGNHGFSFSAIAPLKDGKEHSLYVYIQKYDGVLYQIGNTPLYLTCTP